MQALVNTNPVERAYLISPINPPEDWDASKTIYAATAGKAKYEYLLDMWDAGWERIGFQHLRCQSLGGRQRPLTQKQISQHECDAFNARVPLGTMLHYWSFVKEGAPTGTGLMWHGATVSAAGYPVAWIKGKSSHALTHVEVAA